MNALASPTGDPELDALRADYPAETLSPEDVARISRLLFSWLRWMQRLGWEGGRFQEHYVRLRDGNPADPTSHGGALRAAWEALEAEWRAFAGGSTPEENGPAGPPSPPADRGETWPRFQGDPQQTGNPGTTGPASGSVRWRRRLGHGWCASPLLADGRLYASVPGTRHQAVCLNLETGECRWRSPSPFTDPVLHIYGVPAAASSPRLEDGLIWIRQIGSGGGQGPARHLVGLDPDTGEVRHTWPMGHVDYRAGVARFETGNGRAFGLTGRQEIGERPPRIAPMCEVTSVDLRTGRETWRFSTGPIHDAPEVRGDAVWAAAADGAVFRLRASSAAGAGVNPWEAAGPADNPLVWQTSLGVRLAESPRLSADGAGLFLGSEEGAVYSIDADTGEQRWKTRVEEPAPGAFRQFSGILELPEERLLIFGSAGGRLHALDSDDGSKVWSVDLDADWIRARPMLSGGSLWVGDWSGRVVRLEYKGRREPLVRDSLPVSDVPLLADPAGDERRVVFTDSDMWMTCLDSRTGDTVWRQPLLVHADWNGLIRPVDTPAGGGYQQSSPVLTPDRVMVGGGGRCVHALDVADGATLWRHELSSAVSGSPTLADGRVFFGQQGGESDFVCLDARTGRLLWSIDIGWVWSSVAVVDGKVLAPSVDGSIHALDAGTGHILWRRRTAGACHPMPAVSPDGRLALFGSWDGFLYALRTADGSVAWKRYTGGVPDSGSPLIWNDRVYYTVMGDQVACCRLGDGRDIWLKRWPGENFNMTPAVGPDGTLLLSSAVWPSANGCAAWVLGIDPESGTERWRHAGGGFTCPVVGGGRVYTAGSSDPWFRCLEIRDGAATPRWRVHLNGMVDEASPALANGLAGVLDGTGTLTMIQ